MQSSRMSLRIGLLICKDRFANGDLKSTPIARMLSQVTANACECPTMFTLLTQALPILRWARRTRCKAGVVFRRSSGVTAGFVELAGIQKGSAIRMQNQAFG